MKTTDAPAKVVAAAEFLLEGTGGAPQAEPQRRARLRRAGEDRSASRSGRSRRCDYEDWQQGQGRRNLKRRTELTLYCELIGASGNDCGFFATTNRPVSRRISMKSVRYTKYTGDLASEIDMEGLLQALSEYLLDSGFRDPYAQFQDLEHNLENLREALRRLLESGDIFR